MVGNQPSPQPRPNPAARIDPDARSAIPPCSPHALKCISSTGFCPDASSLGEATQFEYVRDLSCRGSTKYDRMVDQPSTTAIIAGCAISLAVAAATLVLRLITRLHIVKVFGAEDAFLIAALVCSMSPSPGTYSLWRSPALAHTARWHVEGTICLPRNRSGVS